MQYCCSTDIDLRSLLAYVSVLIRERLAGCSYGTSALSTAVLASDWVYGCTINPIGLSYSLQVTQPQLHAGFSVPYDCIMAISVLADFIIQ